MVQALRQHGPITGAVVEIGSRNVNGGVRDLLPDAESYLGIDIVSGPGVDLVCDAADWVPDRTYDLVICNETFEHTPRWREILVVAARAMSRDGLLLLTCATVPRKPHSAHTDRAGVRYGEYYGNVLAMDFRRAAVEAGLSCDIIVDSDRGDLTASCRLAPVR